jgi:hypothetical protein
MRLPWHPANPNAAFPKKRAIDPLLPIKRYHMRIHLNTSLLQKR